MLVKSLPRLCAHANAAHNPSEGIGLTHYGTGLNSGPVTSDFHEGSGLLKSTPRGVKFSNCLDETNTAIYDGSVSFTYFQPYKVSIEKLGLPEKKYYQKLTRKPWDISSTEWVELMYRRRYIQWWFFLCCILMTTMVLHREKQYSGVRGSDGFWVMLPKGDPGKF
ncbi:fasciclin-1-like protein [Perkinsela sp. CCAP 1560/4]|nr:fasciclin-1-like protein [Perkinsela sp. CCAP 1560/4]|eukprot:KNH07606.1 fasciclin-1-like protein [Perkinsela sp. CCAP 1560/4]